MRLRFLFAIGLFLLNASFGFAFETGKILNDQAVAYSKPSILSQPVQTFKKGQKVLIGFEMTRAQDGSYWYRVKTSTKGLGYLPAKDVRSKDIDRELASMGLESGAISIVDNYHPPRFTFRTLGFFARQLSQNTSEWGADLEASYTLPLADRGYWKRAISIGMSAFYQPSNQATLVASLAVQLTTKSWIHPELRLRAGLQNGLTWGVHLGANIPISRVEETFSVYLDSAIYSFPISASQWVWIASGMGIHF